MRAKISVNFIKGFSRVLDLNGTKQWPSVSEDRKMDYEAIRSDWENVGRTIERETGKFKRNNGFE